MPAKKKTTRKTVAKKADVASAPVKQSSKPQNKNMFSKRNIIVAAILLLVVVGALLYIFRGMFIAATVNGQVITKYELDKVLEKKYGKAQLENLIIKNVIYSEMKKKGIEVTDDQVNSEIKKAEDSLKQQGTTIDERLAALSMTREDLADQIRVNEMSKKLFAGQIKVTQKEIDDYIEQNKDAIPEGQDEKTTQAQAKQALEQQKLTTKFQAWLADLQKKANVKYYVNF